MVPFQTYTIFYFPFFLDLEHECPQRNVHLNYYDARLEEPLVREEQVVVDCRGASAWQPRSVASTPTYKNGNESKREREREEKRRSELVLVWKIQFLCMSGNRLKTCNVRAIQRSAEVRGSNTRDIVWEIDAACIFKNPRSHFGKSGSERAKFMSVEAFYCRVVANRKGVEI